MESHSKCEGQSMHVLIHLRAHAEACLQLTHPDDRTGICLGTDMTISAYYFGIF